MDSAQQTETIREYEHLRYIPIVLLAPVRSCCEFLLNLLIPVFSVILEPTPFELYVMMPEGVVVD